MQRFISWPNEEEAARCQQKFFQITGGFPRIVGLIDGTQIPIYGPHPPANEATFVNRKGVHAINCQVVCDVNKRLYPLMQDGLGPRMMRIFCEIGKFLKYLIQALWKMVYYLETQDMDSRLGF